MKRALQLVGQLLFVVIFAVLIATGRVQIWIGLIIAGIVISLLLGRVYCGWVCPINTVMNVVTWIKQKFSFKGFKIPQFVKNPWVRYLMLGLFLGTFILTIITGNKLPVLPALFAAGVLLTFFFPEELWHRYLCPYGTILSLPSSKSKFSMKIDQDLCTNCGACKRVCPAAAVENCEEKYTITKNNCLVCTDCVPECRQNAISYR